MQLVTSDAHNKAIIVVVGEEKEGGMVTIRCHLGESRVKLCKQYKFKFTLGTIRDLPPMTSMVVLCSAYFMLCTHRRFDPTGLPINIVVRTLLSTLRVRATKRHSHHTIIAFKGRPVNTITQSDSSLDCQRIITLTE